MTEQNQLTPGFQRPGNRALIRVHLPGLLRKPGRSKWSCSASVGRRLVADERLFRVIVSAEQKRSARSGRSLLLVVLRIRDLANRPNGTGLFAPLERRIFPVTRETDLVGWQDANQRELGILFTEIAEINESVVSALLERVRKAVREHRLLEELIVISYRVLGNGRNSLEPLGPLALAGD